MDSYYNSLTCQLDAFRYNHKISVLMIATKQSAGMSILRLASLSYLVMDLEQMLQGGLCVSMNHQKGSKASNWMPLYPEMNF